MGLAACDAGDPQLQEVDAPPVHVIEVLASTGVDADGKPVKVALAGDGSTTGVLPTSSLVIRFDRFLEPVSVSRQSFCVSGTTTAVNDPAGCVEGRAFEQPVYDPVHRTATLYLPAGQTLPLATKHTVTMLAPPAEPGDLDFGFRAFDGAPLEATTAFQFTTVDSDPDGPIERPSAEDRFCKAAACLGERELSPAVLTCQAACDPMLSAADCLASCCPGGALTLLNGCAYTTCHAPSSDEANPLGAAMGLDMLTTDFIRLTAIGKTAHQTQQGEHADDGDQNPARFGRAMPIIDPGSAGNSYLMYKVMAHPDFLTLSNGELDPAEQQRMRSTLVVGMPMPAVPFSSLSKLQQYEALSAWIAQGAPTTCP